MKKGQTTLRKRICKCGKEFDGGPRALYCPDCRAEKRKEYDKKAKLNKKLGKNIKIGVTIRKCAVCGEPFIMMSSQQKYCKKCASDAIKAADRAQSRGWLQRAVNKYGKIYTIKRNTKRRSEKQEKICTVCGDKFIAKNKNSKTCSDRCQRIYATFLHSKEKSFAMWKKKAFAPHNYARMSWNKAQQKWVAYYKSKYLGAFEKREDATSAVQAMHKKTYKKYDYESMLGKKIQGSHLTIFKIDDDMAYCHCNLCGNDKWIRKVFVASKKQISCNCVHNTTAKTNFHSKS